MASDVEQNQGDDELSTLSATHFLDDDDFFDTDSDDSFSKPKKKDSKSPQKKKESKGSKDKKIGTVKKKEHLFLQRDIAEGRAFNNSFTGPYPEDNDHLHVDKGANPQFQFFRSKAN